MDRIQMYKQYRDVQKDLFIKIINFAQEKYIKDILNAARSLGFSTVNKTIIFKRQDESEFPFIMDYFLHEYKFKDKTVCDIYREEVGVENEIEEKILKGMKESYISLYKVVNVSEEKKLVFLMDMLNNVRNTRLTDIGFSESIEVDKLFFTRVLKLDDFSMTSGMAFVFDNTYLENIMEAVNHIKKTVSKENKRILETYNIMKKANDQFGFEALYV